MDDAERTGRGIDTLPGSLGEALEELKRDRVVREALGGAYRNFVEYKKKEWNVYLEYLESMELPENTKKVTEWELERYFYV